jgi:hypothetical protein
MPEFSADVIEGRNGSVSIKSKIQVKLYLVLLGCIWGMTATTQPSQAQLSDDMLERELASPAGITATPGLGRIAVAWDPSTEEGVLGYNVYRSSSYDGDYEALPNSEGLPFSVDQTTYIDSGLVVGESFFYRVTSVTALQESPFSEIAGSTVEQRATSDFDTDFTLTPSTPSMSGEEDSGLFLPQSQSDGKLITGRRLAGIGFLLGSAAMAYKGFDFQGEGDKLYKRYEDATDPAEINRLYQRTTNRDVKSQISWAIGAACAVAGVRLIFFGGEEETSLPSVNRVAHNEAAEVKWGVQVSPGKMALRFSRPF